MISNPAALRLTTIGKRDDANAGTFVLVHLSVSCVPCAVHSGCLSAFLSAIRPTVYFLFLL